MKNNSRKSKAFIITFILVLLLLISGYYAFSNRERLFGTNGKLSTNRILSPLFGTSGKTNSNGGIIDNNGTSGNGTGTGTGTGDGTSGSGTGDGSGSGSSGGGTSGSGSGTGSGNGGGTSGSGSGTGSGNGGGTSGSGTGSGTGDGSGGGIKPANFEFKPIPSPLNYTPGNFTTGDFTPGNFTPGDFTPTGGTGHCYDSIMNGNETGIDVGGRCGSGTGGHCYDGIMNGNETGVDVGGRCAGNTGSCTDDIKNGNETGVDTGGRCGSGTGTGGGTGHCYDGIKNGNETGIDVGGRCVGNTGSCTDVIKNGNETGIDVGGRCGGGTGGHCYDGIKNGNETGIDVGGRCGSGTGGPGNTSGPDDNPYKEIVRENECPIDPLENYLTAEDRKKLEDITAEFYNLAYTLRTPDDIKLIKDEITQIEKDIIEAEQLTKECEDQKSDYRYTGPKTIYGNPYYARETRYDFDPSLGKTYSTATNPTDFVKYVTEESERSGEKRSKSGWTPRINERHFFVYKNSYLGNSKSDWLENIVSPYLDTARTLSNIVSSVLIPTETEKEAGAAYARYLIKNITSVSLTDEDHSGPLSIDNDDNAEGYLIPNNYAIFEAMFDVW